MPRSRRYDFRIGRRDRKRYASKLSIYGSTTKLSNSQIFRSPDLPISRVSVLSRLSKGILTYFETILKQFSGHLGDISRLYCKPLKLDKLLRIGRLPAEAEKSRL